MSTEWDIRPLYLCGFLKNRFSGHSTFVLSLSTIVILQVAALSSERFFTSKYSCTLQCAGILLLQLQRGCFTVAFVLEIPALHQQFLCSHLVETKRPKKLWNVRAARASLKAKPCSKLTEFIDLSSCRKYVRVLKSFGCSASPDPHHFCHGLLC